MVNHVKSDWDQPANKPIETKRIDAPDRHTSQSFSAVCILGAIAVGVVVVAGGRSEEGVAIDPATTTCTTPALVQRARRMVQQTTSPLFRNIQIFKLWDIRTNPYFGKREPTMMQYGNQILSGSHSEKEIGESMFADRSSQCTAELMTDRGHLRLQYGWKVIDGETFITGGFLPGSDEGM